MKNNLSFEFYFNVFCGGKNGVLSRDVFDRFALAAERELSGFVAPDQFGKIPSETLLVCLCEIAELLFVSEKNSGIKSERVDGYSVTFSDGDEFRGKVRRIVLQRLGHLGVLFAGVAE